MLQNGLRPPTTHLLLKASSPDGVVRIQENRTALRRRQTGHSARAVYVEPAYGVIRYGPPERAADDARCVIQNDSIKPQQKQAEAADRYGADQEREQKESRPTLAKQNIGSDASGESKIAGASEREPRSASSDLDDHRRRLLVEQTLAQLAHDLLSFAVQALRAAIEFTDIG